MSATDTIMPMSKVIYLLVESILIAIRLRERWVLGVLSLSCFSRIIQGQPPLCTTPTYTRSLIAGASRSNKMVSHWFPKEILRCLLIAAQSSQDYQLKTFRRSGKHCTRRLIHLLPSISALAALQINMFRSISKQAQYKH